MFQVILWKSYIQSKYEKIVNIHNAIRLQLILRRPLLKTVLNHLVSGGKLPHFQPYHIFLIYISNDKFSSFQIINISFHTFSKETHRYMKIKYQYGQLTFIQKIHTAYIFNYTKFCITFKCKTKYYCLRTIQYETTNSDSV